MHCLKPHLKTLGRSLIEGTKDITLFGEAIHVNAQIHNLEGFSGHADRDGLITWLKGFQKKPKQLFLVHGEPDAKEALAKTIKEETGMDATVITQVSEYEIVNDEVVGVEEIYSDAIDNEAFEATKNRIAGLNDQMDRLLYATSLAMNEQVSPERISRINDLVLQLEKAAINLGAAITSTDESGKQIEEESKK